MADDVPLSADVQSVPRPRRWGMKDEDAMLTLGREVEYRFSRSHPMCALLQTIVRHWNDGDPLVRLYRRLYPYRDMLRSNPSGQFVGSWNERKIDLHVTPRPEEDWSETTPLRAILPKPSAHSQFKRVPKKLDDRAIS